MYSSSCTCAGITITVYFTIHRSERRAPARPQGAWSNQGFFRVLRCGTVARCLIPCSCAPYSSYRVCEPFLLRHVQSWISRFLRSVNLELLTVSQAVEQPWNRKISYRDAPLRYRDEWKSLSSEEEEEKRAVAQALVSAAPPQAAPFTLFC